LKKLETVEFPMSEYLDESALQHVQHQKTMLVM